MSQAATNGAMGGAASGASAGSAAGPWGALIGGVAGGLVGMSAGQSANAAQVAEMNARLDQMAQIGAIDLPTYQQRKIYLQRLEQGQPLTPDMVQELKQGDTELAKFKEDSDLKNTQLSALSALKDKARMGGLDLNDRAALIDSSREIDRQNLGQQNAVMQNMEARGMGGSGSELAQKLADTQNSAQLASKNSLDVAGQARLSAINALKDSASIARNIGSDEYNRAAAVANNQDAINRNNMQNSQAVKTYNISTANNAKQVNMNRANNVADQNTNIANQEQAYNKELLMKDYNDRVNRVGQLTGMNVANKGIDNTNAKNNASGTMGIIGGLGGVASGLKSSFGSSGSNGGTGTGSSVALAGDDEEKDWNVA